MSVSKKQLFRALKAAFNQELPALTIELAKDYLAKYSDDVSAWMYYGIALQSVARYEEAREAFASVEPHFPKDRMDILYTQVGFLYEDQGDMAQAADWFRKALAFAPEKADGYIFMGAMLARSGKLDEAEERHRTATHCATGCIDEAYFNLGCILRAKEKYVEAYDCFRKALEMDPHYSAAKRAIKDLEKVFSLLVKV